MSLPVVLLAALLAMTASLQVASSSVRMASGGRQLRLSMSDCEVLEQMDFPRAVSINDGNRLIVENAGECCEECKKTEGCALWTFQDVELGKAAQNSCWLKRPDSTTVDCEQCTSGIRPVDDSGLVRPRSARIVETCIMMENLDFNQGDLHPLGGVPTMSLTECCDLCRAEPDCKAWTRTFNGQCFLKGSVNSPSICQHCEASGLVDGRATSKELGAVREFLELVASNTIFSARDAAVFLRQVNGLTPRGYGATRGQKERDQVVGARNIV